MKKQRAKKSQDNYEGEGDGLSSYCETIINQQAYRKSKNSQNSAAVVWGGEQSGRRKRDVKVDSVQAAWR